MSMRNHFPVSPSICVLGSANMDLIVQQPWLPRPGETIAGKGFSVVPGGKGLNQAIAAVRAGAHVEFLGAVGSDAFGSELRACLADEGVGTDGLIEVATPTGVAQVSVTDDGENSIVVVAGANALIEPRADQLLVHIQNAGYLMSQLERPYPLVLGAMRLAHEVGTVTALTPAPAHSMKHELLQFVDILLLNAHEARDLAGEEDEHRAARQLSQQVGLVIMTRGPLGVIAAQDGQIIHELSGEPVKAIDTTGAGDTFAGYFVAMLASGRELGEALAIASRAAGISVTRHGASTSIPRAHEVSGASG
ncbi:ribokinase [Leifsonia sp. NPDC058230]|uniref:ribokinase n=1 Tax=Leifsonia sp. NPDC058230 TaxID=3346391 RepID=UPI0036DE5991